MDTLLSLDPGRLDLLYRIRRVSSTAAANRVVYVTVTNPDIIPEEKRTYGPSVVRELSSKLEREWNGDWTTLRVHMVDDGSGRIWCEPDVFQPHALPKKHLLDDYYPKYDIFDLGVRRRSVNHRVSEVVLHDGRACFVKVARFPHELPFLVREVEAYRILGASRLAPKFVGYVFEESPDRVVGFLAESVEGRAAGLADLEACSRALGELHRFLIHGDLCRYNIIITRDGPKFIDFEQSIPIAELEAKELESLMDEESRGLAARLSDESGAGQPWDLNVG